MINDLLKRIKEAIYGEEVRGSIHDAIEQCYKDAVGHPESVAATVKEIGEVSANLSKETADRKAEVSTERKRIDNLIATGTAQTQEIGKKIIQDSSISSSGIVLKGLTNNNYYYKLFEESGSIDSEFCTITNQQGKYTAKLLKPGLYYMNFKVHVEMSGGFSEEVIAPLKLFKSNTLDWSTFDVLDAETVEISKTENTSINKKIHFLFKITEPSYIRIYIDVDTSHTKAITFRIDGCDITALDWKGKQSADLSELHDLRIGADSTVYGTAGEAVRKQIGNLTEDLVHGFNDNVSYKEHTVDDSLKAIGTPSPLVNSCITISEVLRTFFIKTIKLYVKSSVKDTITIKLLEEPEYGSNAYYETSVEVEADTNKLVEIEVNKLFFRGNSLNILTESKVSLESGTKAMYYYVRNEGTKICEYLKVKKGISNNNFISSTVGFNNGSITYCENIVDTLYNAEQANHSTEQTLYDTLYNTLYNTEQTPFNGTNSLLKLYLDSFFVKAQTGKNLAIKNKFIAKLGTFVNDTAFKWKYDLDPRYGTLFLPAIKEGYSYTNLGGSGLGSFCVLDKTGKVIRGTATEVKDVRHYVYEEGDFLVAFESPFLRKTDKTNPIVVAGQVDELTDEEAYEYAPAKELNNRIKSVEDKLNNISPDVSEQLDIIETSPIYSVYNDVNPSRSYATTLWIDHLINDSKCFNKDVGFTENKNKMLCFGALQFAENEKAKEVKTTLPIYSSDFIIPSTQITHRCSKLTSSNSKFPKILDIGDSVTDGYLASYQKYDRNLPSQYWSWVKYFFALDAKEDVNDASKNNCKMLGITSINGKKYGSSNSFVLNGTTYKNYAVGKGGWSAEDLNLKTFQTEDSLNPFFDEKTSKFSLKAAVDKFKTLADDGVTRLEVGSTAGTEVTDVNAFDFCTPTHVVINLNHNSSLSEYQNTIPDIVKTIKTEYPDMIVILMSIDETGTYFPYLYPEYNENDITWENSSNLHNKNLSIYRYIKESLEDEANNIYVCSGHLVQHPVKSYPSVDNILPETIGGKIEYYGNHSDGSAPNYHPNNIAHKSWGYQLYSLIKYTLAKD